MIAALPVEEFVAAVSVGVVDGEPVLDLDYPEDAACQTDMNVVDDRRGRFVEVQGTAEGEPFARAETGPAAGARRARHCGGWCAAAARAGSVKKHCPCFWKSREKAEIEQLLAAFGTRVITQVELGITEAAEPYDSFLENALAKARHVCFATRLPALADDSGLCVDAPGRGRRGFTRHATRASRDRTRATTKKLLIEMKEKKRSFRPLRIACWC